MGTTKSFKFVYIPWDLSESVEQRELSYAPGQEVECLLNLLKKHFARVGPKSEQQRKMQMDDLRKKVEGADPADEHMNKLLNMAADFTMAETISLLPHIPDSNWVGVNMYVDDSGAIKQLPINRRASEIASCCDCHVQVHGDAFLARVRDNEDEFERMDFLAFELSSSAPWVQEAKRCAQRRRERDNLGEVLEKMKHDAHRGSQRAQITELTPAESAKESGNLAFKRAKYDEAVRQYSEAVSLDGSMTSAYNNRAMAYLRLHRYSEAEGDCDTVLDREENNVKALLRRATARAALGKTDAAIADLQAVLKVQSTNKEAAEKLRSIESQAQAAQPMSIEPPVVEHI